MSDAAISAVRAFWDARPCNLRHSPEPIGERTYFDEVEARKYFVEPHIPRFADFARWRGKRVLEIGCGIGTDTISFARAGAFVTAVDLSPRSLEIARERARVFGCTNVRFYEANAEDLQSVVPLEAYDLVYSFGVLHHTPRPDAALRQLRAYVAPDGCLKLMLYHRFSAKTLGILARSRRLDLWNVDEIVAEASEAQSGCPITYTFSRRRARALLEAAGFDPVAVRVEHIFPFVVEEYVRYRYLRAWPWRALPEPVFRAVERQLGWHLCLTAAPR